MGGNTDGTVGGGKVATRITELVTKSIVTTRAELAGHHRTLGAAILDDFFDKVSGEIRGTTSDLYAMLADHPDTPAEFKGLFNFLARGNGQWQSIVGGTLTGSVISGGIGDIISNLLAPMGHAVIAGQPNNILSPSDVAAAKARGIPIGLDHEGEAAQAGLNSDRFNGLVELNHARPDVSMVLDQLNRGEINPDGARGALLQLGFREADLDGIIASARTLLTPAALADMVVRGILPEDQAATVARQSGVSTEDFHALVLDTGEPPSIQDLLFLHRRGLIDDSRLLHGIRQSRVRDEWIDAIQALAFVPMSTAEAIEGAVQGALTEQQSRAIAAQNGLMAEHWQALYDIAGNPPGVQQMVSLYHRGKLTKDQLIKGIQESRLKNKYIQSTIDGSETLPPERSIVSLVAKGSLTDDQGMRLLLERGYAPDIAAALMANAHATKTATTRTLTESMVSTLYEDQAMSKEDAMTILAGLGYSQGDAQWVLDLADVSRTHKYQQAAIGKVGSAYTKGLMDQDTAMADLRQLGMPQAQIDLVLSYWDLELNTVTKTLTEAQVVAAAKRGAITPDDATLRLKGMGYGDVDVAILLSSVAPPATPNSGPMGVSA